jgi:N-acetylglucosaminyldiphosphoundecaprenol N-acetyl-beta-D-mannosaminyltransferase
MQKRGLEWLFRLCQEPGRLWKRYLTTNTHFVLLFAKELVTRKRRAAMVAQA